MYVLTKMLQVVKFMIAVLTLSKVLVSYYGGGGALQNGKGGGATQVLFP